MYKTFTVRLGDDLYQQVRAVARRRQLSLNALVRQGLEAIAKEEEEAIQEMIDSGFLRPTRRSGAVREWKWKPVRSKAA